MGVGVGVGVRVRVGVRVGVRLGRRRRIRVRLRRRVRGGFPPSRHPLTTDHYLLLMTNYLPRSILI